ncbi:hypothetical protein [Megasphaera elsdenii]|uniref:hypothetical protein n=1 Tax=Megasphaera elsdenii TaxID=907 RepID=UPI00242B1610|nr:hypothetical protein [Megasphaera elsdenii]
MLTWLVIAQLALQAFPSLRFLHRNFLAQVTHRCLNSYYRALQNETVTSRSLRLQTAELACSLIPVALQNEPVFPSVDDTTVPKFGTKERIKFELSGDLIEEVRPLLKYQNPSPQELRSHISWQIQREIFFGTLVSKAQTAKNPTDLVQALCKLASSTSEVA